MITKRHSLTKKPLLVILIVICIYIVFNLLISQLVSDNLKNGIPKIFYMDNPCFPQQCNDTMQAMHERTLAAIKTQDYANCYSKNEDLEPIYTDQCIEKIAIKKGETELCVERRLVNCIWEIAKNKNDPLICNEFLIMSEGATDQEYYVSMRDSCIYKLAH